MACLFSFMFGNYFTWLTPVMNLVPTRTNVNHFGILTLYNYIAIKSTLQRSFVVLMSSCQTRNYGHYISGNRIYNTHQTSVMSLLLIPYRYKWYLAPQGIYDISKLRSLYMNLRWYIVLRKIFYKYRNQLIIFSFEVIFIYIFRYWLCGKIRKWSVYSVKKTVKV